MLTFSTEKPLSLKLDRSKLHHFRKTSGFKFDNRARKEFEYVVCCRDCLLKQYSKEVLWFKIVIFKIFKTIKIYMY